MTKFKYRVFIPEFIEARINRSTQEFEDDDFLSARNFALEYLSEIISSLVSEKIITVSDFKNEESSELIEVSELLKTPENDKILDCERLSECKIQYNYTEKEFRNANELRTQRMSLKQTFFLLGIIKLEIADEKDNFVPVFELKNSDIPINRFVEETIISRLISNFKGLTFPKLYSSFQFNIKEKHHQFREIFLTENNFREKEIISNNLFFDFERKLLSIYNRRCMVSLFIEEEHSKLARKAMLYIQSVYGKLKYEYSPKVMIQNKLYWVYFFDFNTELKITYSKAGNLYFRSASGMKKANEQTTFEEIVCHENCKDDFIRDLLQIL
ncbi:hypothetical protein [Chryseobacterium oryzae]|uniref:Uncharacterized protein n=1 Tax=Chryseobacterium oryzae TaxID=2929799 RepID=A0ABY4BKJ3_9FLAO|nr:hypothetical protein [Chryseobacterium oryzae]UOE39694.1 hypothetical protein MTP08_14700 [Chryseobacterium oryzae]